MSLFQVRLNLAVESTRMRRVGSSVLIALILGACSSSSPDSVVRGFYNAVDKGDVDKAKSFLSMELLQNVGAAKLSAGLRESSKQMEDCGGIKSIEVELDGKGEFREGTSTLIFKGECEAKTEQISLLKEDDKWKLAPVK